MGYAVSVRGIEKGILIDYNDFIGIIWIRIRVKLHNERKHKWISRGRGDAVRAREIEKIILIECNDFIDI